MPIPFMMLAAAAAVTLAALVSQAGYQEERDPCETRPHIYACAIFQVSAPVANAPEKQDLL